MSMMPSAVRRFQRLLGALAFFAAVAGAQETFRIDAAHSDLTFTLGDVLLKVKGTFKVERGEIRVDASGAAAGEIVVDARSGESGSHARDHRMHEQILESARYPEIKFAPARVHGTIAQSGESKVDADGMFTIHGEAHPLTVGIVLKRSGNSFRATSHFPVPYVKWGMKNPSTFVLRVNDTVEIELDLAGTVIER